MGVNTKENRQAFIRGFSKPFNVVIRKTDLPRPPANPVKEALRKMETERDQMFKNMRDSYNNILTLNGHAKSLLEK